MSNTRPTILIIIGRGEAARNFLYSDVLEHLSISSDVILLSVLSADSIPSSKRKHIKKCIDLPVINENRFVCILREVILYAHYRWLWTEKVKNKWETLYFQAKTPIGKFRYLLWRAVIASLANRPTLNLLAKLDQYLSLQFLPPNPFQKTIESIRPNLVFNTSHIHASVSELPVRIAHEMGIPTAAFIFSWDNLTSRGRITVPYNNYLVWNQQMFDQLRWIYPEVSENHITITGTPQFDFHFNKEFLLSREELSRRLGLDSTRPFILYTTGMDRDFPEEVRFIKLIINIIKSGKLSQPPQLVVRTYIKGTSSEMKALATTSIPDVLFPSIQWAEEWITPLYEDQEIYTSLLAHCAMGINPASTVSLELMMFDKPIINLGFDPPGSKLPSCYRWERHVQFDHFAQIANSGATKIARSMQELENYLIQEYHHPDNNHLKRKDFIEEFLGNTLDGKSGERVAETLLNIANKYSRGL